MAEGTEPQTISVEDHNKAVERARRFEAESTDLKKQLDRFKGIDPDKVKADSEALEQLMKEKGTTDQKSLDELITRKEAEFQKRYGDKYTELEGKLGTAEAELKRLRVTNVAMQEAAGIFNSDALELIQARVEADCDFADEEIVIKGEDGKALPSKLDPRKQMGVKEYLQGLAAKYPSTAKATVPQGSKPHGTKMPVGSGPDITVEQFAAMSEADRAQLPRELHNKLSQAYFRK